MKKPDLAAFVAGGLFAIGLAVAGMTRPEKVMGFLDLTGAWDASLMFVMGTAALVSFVAYRLVRRRPAPLFDTKFHLPTRTDIDGRLVGGAAIFGIGWGLGGFCPGPGLVAGVSGSVSAIVFVAGMTVGILLENAILRRRHFLR